MSCFKINSTALFSAQVILSERESINPTCPPWLGVSKKSVGCLAAIERGKQDGERKGSSSALIARVGIDMLVRSCIELEDDQYSATEEKP